MFDTIFIGTSSLLNHSAGLRTVGNNLANVNTPGFKSSQLQFTNLFEQGGGAGQSSGGQTGGGTGMGTLGLDISFRAGLDQSTGNPLDVAINGNGFYAIKRDGHLLYTRAGDFRFDEKGFLVNSGGDRVQGLDADGRLADITLDSLARSVPKATSTVVFNGSISNAAPSTPPVTTGVNSVMVLDANGIDHPVKLSIANEGDGNYTVTVMDAANATIATGAIKFAGIVPVPGSDSMTFSYAPAGTSPVDVKLDFSKTSLGSVANIGVASQDGYVGGTKTDQTIGADGTLTVQYSNGQSAKGPRIALADFQADGALEDAGGAAFRKTANAQVLYGYAGSESFGRLVAGHREGSNVDLAEEFGNLILMQRGYQAASHVVSTANDMIQQLFDMKGR